jgi:hypothetical protein
MLSLLQIYVPVSPSYNLYGWYHKKSRGNDEQDYQVGKISDPGTQGPIQRTIPINGANFIKQRMSMKFQTPWHLQTLLMKILGA